MPKLLIAVVHAQDASQLVEALRGAELRVTEVLSRGGFLQARNAMLYIGVEDDQVDTAMHLIQENCESRTENLSAGPIGVFGEGNWMPAEVTYGGATVFVVPLDEIRRI